MARMYDRVVEELLKEASARGYHCYKVNDSEEDLEVTAETSESEVVKWATAADMGAMYFENTKGDRFGVQLVYGNMLDETICDYSDMPAAHTIVRQVESAMRRL